MSTLAVKDQPAKREPCGSNPDQWYRLLPAGRSTYETKQRVIDETLEAVSICNSCPVRQMCLDLGMEDENLRHGVWGGKLAAERMMDAGYEFTDFYWGSPEAHEFRLMGKVYPEKKTWIDEAYVRAHLRV